MDMTTTARHGTIDDIAYRAILDAVGAYVYTTDKDGYYTYANQLVLDLLGGHPLTEVLGKAFSDFVDIGEAGDSLRDTDRRVLHDGESIFREERNFIPSTNEWRTYWSIKKPLLDESGAIIGMIGISHDITEKKRLEDKVRAQNELLDTVLDNVDALIYMKSADRRFLYVNQATAAAFGMPPEAIIGQRDDALMPADLADHFWEKDRQILASWQRYAGEESVTDSTGKTRHFWSVVAPLRDYDGQPALIGFSTDITELHDLKEELQRQARTDNLTGLANRRSFFEHAEEALSRSRRHGHPLSLIAIDIDHFKQINDDYGHPAGDRVLQDFAGCCNSALREEDLCARTGGEEFCVLLPDTGHDAALVLAERLREMTQDCRPLPEHPALQATISLGVACLGEGDTNFGSLFSRADRALYRAKDLGRNRTISERDLAADK